MKRMNLCAGFVAFVMAVGQLCFAQDRGVWRAANSTAKSITGDIEITETRLFINFAGFTLAQIRQLKPAELASLFDAEANARPDGSGVPAYLYGIDVPADKRFQHKNTLCGSEATRWMVTYAEGRKLHVAFFSSTNMPVFTFDAMQNSTDLCGTFAYER